jgi:hypothetical protein
LGSLLLVVGLVLSACGTAEDAKPEKITDQKIRIGYQKNGPLFILKNI